MTANNQRYQQRLEQTKSSADLYVQRAAQTLNELRKDKESQASAPKTASTETQFNSHELHDTMRAVQADSTIRTKSVTALVKVWLWLHLVFTRITDVQLAIEKFSRARKHRTQEIQVEIVHAPEEAPVNRQAMASRSGAC